MSIRHFCLHIQVLTPTIGRNIPLSIRVDRFELAMMLSFVINLRWVPFLITLRVQLLFWFGDLSSISIRILSDPFISGLLSHLLTGSSIEGKSL